VGIVGERGRLCGAGVLLTNRLVLTCAHVVVQPATAQPRAQVGIELVGLPGRSRGIATVLTWIPEQDDQRGDIALLQLSHPTTGPMSAPLRNISLRNREVRAQGYPHGTRAEAEWATASVIGPGGPNDEWVQLNPRAAVGPRVRQGFSGAGVLDETTEHVVGIVVAASRENSEAAWMIPMDTIAAYLPQVRRLIPDEAVTDQAFVDKARDPLAEVTASDGRDDTRLVHAARVITDWLRPSPHGIAGNLVGPAGADRSAAIAAVVALTDPVSRKQLPADVLSMVPPGLVLPTRSVDLALDATGRTTAQLVRRIAERLAIDVTSPDLLGKVLDAAAAMHLVMDSADDAATPDSLVRDLLEPLAESVPRRGGRLVVGSRKELLPGTVVHVDGSAEERLDRLDAAIAEVDAVERLAQKRYAEIAPRIANAPEPPTRAVNLQIVVFTLRSAGTDDAMLAKAERAAARALRHAGDVVNELNALRARRDELRGLLDAYKTRAVGPLAENAALAEKYREARELLWRGPSDLDAAQVAVHAYLDAVRRLAGPEEAP
jgi:hypothetical protein